MAGGFEDRAAAALTRVVGALPAGEARPGQLAMCRAVAAAVTSGRHLAVQAGTGTGKSLAYLVPAALAVREERVERVVVATATKALQEQLLAHDLPLLADHLGEPVEAALLKGRSNYLCRAALADAEGGLAGDQQLLDLELDGAPDRRRSLEGLVRWAGETSTGDRAEAPVAAPGEVWAAVTVGVGECPGATRCPHGEVCFAEAARDRARVADVVVVNQHLLALDLAMGGALLPEHDLVVVDEAHAFDDVVAGAVGVALSARRFDRVARAVGRFLADGGGSAGAVRDAGARLAASLAGHEGLRVDPADLAGALTAAAERCGQVRARVKEIEGDAAAARRERLGQELDGLVGDLRFVAALPEGHVAWVDDDTEPVLRTAPVAVGDLVAEGLLANRTTVLTSATLAVGGSFGPLAARLGLTVGGLPGATSVPAAADDHSGDHSGDGAADGPASGGCETLDVGSPFDYAGQALLYCATHLPDPRHAEYEEAMLGELGRLVAAAGGRTLALFTSHRAARAAADRLRGAGSWTVRHQDDLPRVRLVREFLDDETAVLCATMGFWQGVDAPGRTVSLVVVDRLPFPRPDEPLHQARRRAAARARVDPFRSVDVPRAAVLLAQGAGRLVRSGTDRGVVAVLDRRLALARYRGAFLRTLPPMRRTTDPAEVAAFLHDVVAPAAGEAAVTAAGGPPAAAVHEQR